METKYADGEGMRLEVNRQKEGEEEGEGREVRKVEGGKRWMKRE